MFDATTTITTCVVGASSTICYGQGEPTYMDWMFVNMWIIFLLSLMSIGIFFKGFKKGVKIK